MLVISSVDLSAGNHHPDLAAFSRGYLKGFESSVAKAGGTLVRKVLHDPVQVSGEDGILVDLVFQVPDRPQSVIRTLASIHDGTVYLGYATGPVEQIASMRAVLGKLRTSWTWR